MDQTALLLEYLKEQYTQARQHETRETNATTFLTALAGALLAWGSKTELFALRAGGSVHC
jgi:hypothetical protein